MNASTAEALGTHDIFRRAFGNDEHLLVTMTDPDLLGPDALGRLAVLTERIERLDGVLHATSLTNVVRLVHGPYGAAPARLYDPSAAASGVRDAMRRALDENPHLTGLLVSPDRLTAGIVVDVEERKEDDAYLARLVESLRGLQREALPGSAEVHLTGIGVQKYDTMRLVRWDQKVMLPLSVAILVLVLAAVTRSFAGVLLPLGVTGMTTLWTIGAYAAAGLRVNVITSLLPPLLLVLSITTSIHLCEEWASSGPAIPDRATRLGQILGDLLSPCFMTALTTAIGLGSLAVSDVPAVRLFGLFGAAGMMLSFALNFTVLPALLSFLDPPTPRAHPIATSIDDVLARSARLTVRRPLLVLLAAGIPTVAAAAALPRISNNTDLLRFFRSDEPLVRDTRFIDRSLGGAVSLELLVKRRDRAPLTTLDDIRRLDALARRIRNLPEVTLTLALTDVLAQLERAERDLAAPTLPEDEAATTALFDLLESAEDTDDLRRFATEDFRLVRLHVRLRAVGTHRAQEILARIDEAAEGALGGDYTVLPTGAFHRVIVDSNRLVQSQVSSFGLALGLVLLVIGLTLRSAKLLIAAIVPNVVPIVWTLGLMGFLGIDLSTATTMIASIVLGVSVDDAIHYLARFRGVYAGDLGSAVAATTRTTGRVLVVTSIVLTLGFWVGGLSSFKPTVYFSLLAGVNMITALVCTLLLLPACLRLLHAEPGIPR